jgi:hypothetical protein
MISTYRLSLNATFAVFVSKRSPKLELSTHKALLCAKTVITSLNWRKNILKQINSSTKAEKLMFTPQTINNQAALIQKLSNNPKYIHKSRKVFSLNKIMSPVSYKKDFNNLFPKEKLSKTSTKRVHNKMRRKAKQKCFNHKRILKNSNKKRNCQKSSRKLHL